MAWLRRIYPFNAEQTVNILSEFGPLVTMFVVNAAAGIEAGTWALIGSTVLAMVVMRLVLGRLPIFPIIASGVTIVFGFMTIATGDAMWIQIKVTIFNAMFAGFLFGGLWAGAGPMSRSSLAATVGIVLVAFAGQAGYIREGVHALSSSSPLLTNLICIAAIAIGFLMGGFIFKRNFFGYVFEKTFHYSVEGWNRFTFSFAWFFVFTAFLNEVVRQVFVDTEIYHVPALGDMDGVNIWILFKIAFIMPLSGLYAWYLTRVMQKYRLDVPPAAEPAAIVVKPPAQIARQPSSSTRTWVLATGLISFLCIGAGVASAYKSTIGSKLGAAISTAAKGSHH